MKSPFTMFGDFIFMGTFIRFYRWLNILSLDVAAGAVICASFFSKLFEVHIKPYGLIALGLTVWIIYTGDHLLDAKRVLKPASSVRHRFHQQHFKMLSVVLILAVLADAVLLLYIREPIIKGGFLLALLVILYFFAQRYLIYIKEVFGALLYAGGVLLAPLSIMERNLQPVEIILILQFGVTALINLLLFTWFDREHDQKDQHPSFTTLFGEKATLNILSILFVLNTSFAAIQVKNGYFLPAVFIMAMNVVLLIILLNKRFFAVNDRFRLLGDIVFLIPSFYFLLQ